MSVDINFEVCGGCQNPKFADLECATCAVTLTSLTMLSKLKRELEQYSRCSRGHVKVTSDCPVCGLEDDNSRLLAANSCLQDDRFPTFIRRTDERDARIAELYVWLGDSLGAHRNTHRGLTSALDEIVELKAQLATANERLTATNARLTAANERLTLANRQLNDSRRYDARTMKLKLWFGEKRVTMPMPIDDVVTDITLA